MKEKLQGVLHKTWRVVRWPLGVLLVLYIGLVIYRMPAVAEQEKTAKVVAYINAQHITLADVDGSHLPPVPDQAKNDATVAGIDANRNGIRDDVELAVFRLHPDSEKIRAAELQYALALQLELTQVFSSGTWVAVAQKEGRGTSCISDTTPALSPTTTPEFDKKVFALMDARNKEVEDLVFNTALRKEKIKNDASYQTSYASEGGDGCDISLDSLTN